MRVEIVAGFEMRGDQKDHVRVRMITRGSVEAHPRGVADTSPRGADVGVGVVSVDSPCVQDALHVTVVAGSTHVVEDLVVAAFTKGRADPPSDLGEGLFPIDALPLALTTSTGALERVQDPVCIMDLVDRGGTLRAVASPASGMMRVAFEFGDLAGVFVHERQQATAGLAVETGRGDQAEAALGLLAMGPVLGIQLDPVRPAVDGRVVGESGAGEQPFEIAAPALGEVVEQRHEESSQLSGTD